MTSPTGRLWLWFSETSPPVPLGLYDHEDDTPGVGSVELPATDIPKALKAATKFIESVDDWLPSPTVKFFEVLAHEAGGG